MLLIKGAEWLITGSASIAKKYSISSMVIGLTIVSVGTSAPELIISLIAIAGEKSSIAIGTIFGSNISNVLLILGLTALIYPIPIRRNTVRTDILFVLIATLLVGFLANAKIFAIRDLSDSTNSILSAKSSLYDLAISRGDGIILLFFFLLFLSYAIKMNKKDEEGYKSDILEKPIKQSVIYLLAGVVFLFFGGKWVVEGASEIAVLLGFSEGFVGFTIVAIGTSLPELVTSLMAAYKKNVDMAVGNIIGSNIFNLLWVIGVSALFRPLHFCPENNFDILVMLFSATLIIMVIAVNKRVAITKWSGILFLILYAGYIAYLFYRG